MASLTFWPVAGCLSGDPSCDAPPLLHVASHPPGGERMLPHSGLRGPKCTNAFQASAVSRYHVCCSVTGKASHMARLRISSAGAKGMDAEAGMSKLGPLLQQFASEGQKDGNCFGRQHNKNKIRTVHHLNNLKNPT